MTVVTQVFDSREESFVEIDNAFNVVHAMPQAISIIQFFFPEHSNSARLPDAIANWLKNEFSNQPKYGNSSITPVTSSFVRCSRKLIVIAFINSSMGAMTISFREDQVAYRDYKRLVDRLTRRQKEVFHLMADRVRDIHEIAKRLGISHRTVEEHRRIIHLKVKQIGSSVLY